MTSLQQRYEAAVPVLAGLGRVDANGDPVVGRLFQERAPDQWRLIREACFGVLWTRPALTMRQRSIVTMSCLAVLRRDENLRGHLLSALDIGLAPAEILELMLQLLLYTGAPISNTALGVADEVFKQRGLEASLASVYDATEDPERLYERGRALRAQVLAEDAAGALESDVQRASYRYEVEYVWGSVWSRAGLPLEERVLVVLSALAALGLEDELAKYARGARRLGLTQAQIEELCFHLSFYIGLPLSTRALDVVHRAVGGSQGR